MPESLCYLISVSLAMNMIMVGSRYLPAVRGTPAEEEDASVCTWPGLREYGAGEGNSLTG
jgi:hypothetical protein